MYEYVWKVEPYNDLFELLFSVQIWCFQLQESDFDETSLSLCESTEASERMRGDFFNTVKKGPGKIILTTIEPPPEFQVKISKYY